MAETHETIADIVAEMRMGNTGPYPFAYLIGRAGGPLGNVIEQVTVKELADRLEAAHRRELATGGNAAKLREALAPFPSLCEWLIENAQKIGIADIVPKLRERCDKAKAALAAPPRNCDRPECATVQGADEEFCKAGERDHSLGMCWEDLCYWLLAPAEGREGGVK